MSRKLGLAMKRAFDVVGSICLLALFSPFILLTAILVGLNFGWPIIHRSKRIAQNAGVFYAYKFKTMLDLRGPDGKFLPDAKRLTKFGNFLRATSMDELPQLINIIKGEMSLIGPRAILTDFLAHLDQKELRRLQMKPGITGLAQVNGRNSLEWDKRLEMDVWYVDNWSLWLDLKIMFKTIPVWLGAQGINTPGHATYQRLDELRPLSAHVPPKPAASASMREAEAPAPVRVSTHV